MLKKLVFIFSCFLSVAAFAMAPLPASLQPDGLMEFGVELHNETSTDFRVEYSYSEAEPEVRILEVQPQHTEIVEFAQPQNMDGRMRTAFSLLQGGLRAVAVVIVSPNVICVPYLAQYTCQVERLSENFVKLRVGSAENAG